MVLLPKPGRSSNSPSDYRPVCLLDGAGKLLKRVVAARLESHLSRSVPGLHDSQFGFEAPLWSSNLSRGSDGQPPQSPEGQEVAQDGGHQGSEGLPHHFGGSSCGARRDSPVRTAGTEVSRNLPPHSGSVGRGQWAPTLRVGLDWSCSTDGLDTRAGAPGLRVLEAVFPNWDVWLDGAGPPPPRLTG